MPAVVRVKRRIDEEPLSTLVLGRKRRRISESEEEQEGAVGSSTSSVKPEYSTLLKFAGTIAEQEHSAVVQQYAKLSKMEAQKLLKQKTHCLVNNITEKNRREMMHHIHEQRFEVVNCLRTPLEVNDCDEEEAKTEMANDENCDKDNDKLIRNKRSVKELTIVDIERQYHHNDQQSQSILTPPAANDGSTTELVETNDYMEGVNNHQHINSELFSDVRNSDMDYVYDIYLLENEEAIAANESMDSYYLSVRPFDDLVYYNRNEEMEDDNISIDSNDENHYGNDYPEDTTSSEEYDEDNHDSFYCNDDEDEYEHCGNYRKSKLTKKMKNLSNAVADFILYDDDDDDDDYYGGQESHNSSKIDDFLDKSSSDDDPEYEQVANSYIRCLKAAGTTYNKRFD